LKKSCCWWKYHQENTAPSKIPKKTESQSRTIQERSERKEYTEPKYQFRRKKENRHLTKSKINARKQESKNVDIQKESLKNSK
jgi:hypothetical protein